MYDLQVTFIIPLDAGTARRSTPKRPVGTPLAESRPRPRPNPKLVAWVAGGAASLFLLTCIIIWLEVGSSQSRPAVAPIPNNVLGTPQKSQVDKVTLAIAAAKAADEQAAAIAKKAELEKQAAMEEQQRQDKLERQRLEREQQQLDELQQRRLATEEQQRIKERQYPSLHPWIEDIENYPEKFFNKFVRIEKVKLSGGGIKREVDLGRFVIAVRSERGRYYGAFSFGAVFFSTSDRIGNALLDDLPEGTEFFDVTLFCEVLSHKRQFAPRAVPEINVYHIDVYNRGGKLSKSFQ